MDRISHPAYALGRPKGQDSPRRYPLRFSPRCVRFLRQAARQPLLHLRQPDPRLARPATDLPEKAPFTLGGILDLQRLNRDLIVS